VEALTGPNPVDRGKPGSKYHLLVDRRGIPLAVGLSAANLHDSMLLEQVVDAIPAVKGPRGRPGRPRKRPAKLHLDKGYDSPAAGGHCAAAGSRPGSPVAGSSPRLGWVATAG
jgi:Transposase DDE domain